MAERQDSTLFSPTVYAPNAPLWRIGYAYHAPLWRTGCAS